MQDGKSPPIDNGTADEAGEDNHPQRIAELEAELAEVKDRALRLLAEQDNIRKRAEKERQDAQAYGAAALAKELLTVADNLSRALEAATQNKADAPPALIDGIAATKRELFAVFARNGIVPIEPAGAPFDPNQHEALCEVESDAPAGQVVEVMAIGWRLGERLLRPARVSVAKAKPQDTPSAEGKPSAEETPPKPAKN